MKASNRLRRKSFPGRGAFFYSTVLGLLILLSGPAQAQVPGALPAVQPTAHAEGSMATNQPPKPLSRGVAEILRMADAGVSSEIIKTFVECSATPYQPTDADVIALKKHNVPDEIVTLLLKRGAQVRAAIVQARQDALNRALTARRMAAGGLDPESYEYFQHYYLQPRALASAYERLAPYYPSFPYPYGYPPR